MLNQFLAEIIDKKTFQTTLEANKASISDSSRFLACTLYWQFPDLAWQPSFPRLDNESPLIVVRNSVVPSLQTLGDSLVQALTMQWYDETYFVAVFKSFSQFLMVLFFRWKNAMKTFKEPNFIFL